MGNTNFLSFRELRASATKIDNMLNDNGKIVVTNNGKPKALMIQITENNFEETISIVNQIKFSKAIDNIRDTTQKNGAADMTLDDINAEIAAARNERKNKTVLGKIND